MDWDLIDKLGRAARYQSESEKADAVYLSKARNYELYAKPEGEEMSPLIAWTLSDEWTDPRPYADNGYRVHAAGEINPSR